MLMIHCALLRIIAKILTLLLEYVPEITEVNAPGFNVIYYMLLCLQDHNIRLFCHFEGQLLYTPKSAFRVL